MTVSVSIRARVWVRTLMSDRPCRPSWPSPPTFQPTDIPAPVIGREMSQDAVAGRGHKEPPTRLPGDAPTGRRAYRATRLPGDAAAGVSVAACSVPSTSYRDP